MLGPMIRYARVGALALGLALFGCQPQITEGRFGCVVDEDCPPELVCRPEIGRCYLTRLDAGPPRDAGPPSVDSGPTDAGPVDAGPVDAGLPDAGESDAGSHDAGPSDAGEQDAALSDAGPNDSGLSDAGLSDAGPNDAGPDAG